MAITSQEFEYLTIIVLVSGFVTIIVNSLFKTNNLFIGILGLLAVAYIFRIK